MIIDVTIRYEDSVKVPPSTTGVHRTVVCHDVVDVPEYSRDEAPVALRYVETGVPRVARLLDGVLYGLAGFPDPPVGRADLRRLASDGSLFGKPGKLGEIREDALGLKARSERGREAFEWHVKGLTLIDDELWKPLEREPALHFASWGRRLTGRVSSTVPGLEGYSFCLRDADFAPAAIEALTGLPRRDLALPEFSLELPDAFKEPFEAYSLAVAGEELATELRKGLADRSEAELVAYARLRDRCRVTSWWDEGVKPSDEVLGAQVASAIHDALPLVKAGRRLRETVDARVRRWESFLVFDARRKDALDEAEGAEVGPLSAMKP